MTYLASLPPRLGKRADGWTPSAHAGNWQPDSPGTTSMDRYGPLNRLLHDYRPQRFLPMKRSRPIITLTMIRAAAPVGTPADRADCARIVGFQAADYRFSEPLASLPSASGARGWGSPVRTDRAVATSGSPART
jgi:hypothetical protein